VAYKRLRTEYGQGDAAMSISETNAEIVDVGNSHHDFELSDIRNQKYKGQLLTIQKRNRTWMPANLVVIDD
jgi:hypothetical protein